MTAFSRVEGEGFIWEIRSENHRGLDIRVKLPDELQPLELELVQAMKSSTARGKIQISCRENRVAVNDSDQRESRISKLAESLESLVRALPPNVTPSVDLMALLRSSDNESDQFSNEVSDLPSVKSTFGKALEAFHIDREREGAQLKKIVLEKVHCCHQCARALRNQQDEQISLVQSNIDQRLENLNASVDPQRLAQEVALMVQKADYSEELDRINVHLVEIESRLSVEEPSGRRLVFLAQELAREANTLASKTQSGHCSLLAVDLKVHVDQIREQVQNIE
ncbi:MAG: DUF1732 domain-containing protein [Gammaproteobacteria bacterium]|nr:DUF1732 domain-containing protein [Gammaproteobacteria bacterium]